MHQHPMARSFRKQRFWGRNETHPNLINNALIHLHSSRCGNAFRYFMFFVDQIITSLCVEKPVAFDKVSK